MAKIYCKSSYLLRRDTAENWENKNPILRKGEQGLETDTGIMKIGDGVTAFNSLSDDNIYFPKSRINKSVDNVKSYANSTFSNALKGSKSGSAFLIDDISPVTHNMDVKVRGKNLLSEMSLFPTVTNNAVPIHFKAGQKYTISFTTTYTAWRLMFYGTDKNGKAFDNSSTDANKYISEMYTGTTGRLQHASNRSGNTFTFTCNEDCIITAIVFWNVSNETDKTYSDFQLELGTTATAYTPYVDLTAVKVIKSNASSEVVAEYTPTADGTVEGVTSLYPNTTLMTDTDGVIIECEYNKDINIVLKHININTWKDVQDTVRAGFGHIRFPVGYEFTTEDSVTGAVITWVVRAHDHHTAANNKLTHTMTLETKNVYSLSSGAQKAVQYDATEAFYYAEQELAAGTYNITIANQTWYTADNGKTFQFTLATAVPVGGQLVFDMTYNATLEGKSVKSYANKTTTTALETVTLTEGSEGTSLGTTNGSSPNVNHMYRAIFGSNNYAQSAVRQWLNSAAVAGSVWTPTNVFDRPASWATSYNGFMHGLPADFLAVVQPAVVPCRTNSVFEVASLDGTVFTTNQVYNLADKFFLLSRPEIFGEWDSASYKDGTQLEYYNGLTATERIKRDAAGTARSAWLRSPHSSDANIARVFNSSGEVHNNYAYDGNAVAPACIIA